MNKVMERFNKIPWRARIEVSNVFPILEWQLEDIDKKVLSGDKDLLGLTIKPPHKEDGVTLAGEITIVLNNEIIGILYKPHDHKIISYKKMAY